MQNLTSPHSWICPSQSNTVIGNLQAIGYEAFYVGGCVRDMFLGRKPKDFDIATSATPEQIQDIFPKTIPTGIKHGTITVVMEDENIEVTTFRSEGNYADGRRPDSVKFETDLKADLSRRDFTINAIAYNSSNGIVEDPFGGQADLKAGIIRAVGNPAERFTEDGLRCIRAARFASVLGFDIEVETLKAIPQAITTFKKVSRERIREEFSKLIVGSHVTKGLNYLESMGLLRAIFPHVQINARQAGSLIEECGWADLNICLALFFSQAEMTSSEVLKTMKSMTFPTKTAEAVTNIIRNVIPNEAFEDWDDEQIRHWLAKVTPPACNDVLLVSRILREAATQDFVKRIKGIRNSHPPLYAKDLALDGNEIKAIVGSKPSAIVGAAIRFLLEMVIEDPTQNTKEGLTQLLRNNFACEDDKQCMINADLRAQGACKCPPNLVELRMHTSSCLEGRE